MPISESHESFEQYKQRYLTAAIEAGHAHTAAHNIGEAIGSAIQGIRAAVQALESTSDDQETLVTRESNLVAALVQAFGIDVQADLGIEQTGPQEGEYDEDRIAPVIAEGVTEALLTLKTGLSNMESLLRTTNMAAEQFKTRRHIAQEVVTIVEELQRPLK